MFFQYLLTAIPLVVLTTPFFAQAADPNTKLDSIFPLFNISDPASLSAIGLKCAAPGGDRDHKLKVVFDDCLHAIGRTFKRVDDVDFIMPKVWATADVPDPKAVTIPRGWQTDTCAMVIGTARKTDAGRFSLVTAAHFASLILDNCVEGQKRPFGGRFEIMDGGMYVDVTGNVPRPEAPDVQVETAK